MAYATLQNLKDRLGSATSPPGLYQQITDRLAATTASDTVGQELLDSAEAIVNQKLASKYEVPVDTAGQAATADWLRNAVLVIATYNGWVQHPIRSKLKDTVKADYDQIMATLSAIARGDESLPSSGALPGPTSTGTIAEATGHERIFTEEGMSGL